MAENKMRGFAELLGLELDEEFKLYGIVDKYKLTIDGIMRCSPYDKEWLYDNLPMQVLTGKFEIIKLPNPILDDDEKKYLSSIIKPFRNRILYIAKAETVKTYDNPNAKIYECIYIMYKDSSKKQNPFYMGLPCFTKGTMYKGMEYGKKYTLDDLGI